MTEVNHLRALARRERGEGGGERDRVRRDEGNEEESEGREAKVRSYVLCLVPIRKLTSPL